MLERVHEHGALASGVRGGSVEGITDSAIDQFDLRAVCACGGDFGQWGPGGHEHAGRNTGQPRGQRDALRVVACRRAHHPAAAFLGRQVDDAVVGAAKLERSRALQVLALEQHPSADQLGHRTRGFQRRCGDDAVQSQPRLEDLLELDEISHRHLTVSALERDRTAPGRQRGRVTVTRPPGRAWICSRPPCASTRPRAIGRPRPAPPPSRVRAASNRVDTSAA